MKVICSWCRREGNAGIFGEKPPLDDDRETHGICSIHHDLVRDRWMASLKVTEGIGEGIDDNVSRII